MRVPVASNEPREVMDIRHAAEYLGISADTLYKYASEGFIPAFKLGNRWRFKRSRLNEWMDQRSSEGAERPASGPAARSKEVERTPEVKPATKPVASVRPRGKRSEEARQQSSGS